MLFKRLLSFFIISVYTATATSSRFITKQTRILTIGHLPEHVNGKAKLLKEAGFLDTKGIIASQMSKEDIMNLLKDSPRSLFIVGGAMNKAYPELMAELNTFINKEVPSIIVHNTTISDFPPDCKLPPSEEIIAQSGLTIANRFLKAEEL